MKIRRIKFVAGAMATLLLASSCVGSFSLFNKLSSWNRKATNSKFLNEIIFIVISPVYALAGVADVLLFNSIEFWSGNNPVASNIGKTKQVLGEDGRYYAVKTLKDGYEITKPTGEMLKLVYNEEENSWSRIENGECKEIFRFKDDGTIRTTLPDGNQMDVSLNEYGVNQVRYAVDNGTYWAMR